MRVQLNYYQPLAISDQRGRSPEEFRKCAQRFRDTYRKFEPGREHTLVVTFLRHFPQPEDIALWSGVACRFQTCLPGILGAALLADARRPDCDFLVHIISRAYFHRPGWLSRLLLAREEFGPGMYGSMASYFGCPLQTHPPPNPHLRGSVWGADRELLAEFPHPIRSLDDEYRMECGEWNLSLWFESRGLRSMLVTFDGAYDRPDWDKPENTFLKGDQSNLLNWDRHSDSYRYQIPLEGEKRMDCCTDY